MATLAKYYPSNLVGFFSYSREDDADFGGVLSKFRFAIEAELSAQLGRNRDNFRIWQDKFTIPHGTLWQKQITDGIKHSAFFIPIITPRVVNSPHCTFEFNSFLAREKELGREDLIFPILYISVPELENGTWQENPVLKIVKDRQYLDWRDYRPRELSDPEVKTELIQFCRNISNALRKQWESPEEQRHLAEAERAAAKEDRIIPAQIEAEGKAIGPSAKTSRFAEEERHSKASEQQPLSLIASAIEQRPEPKVAVVKEQDGRETIPGAPLGIVQLLRSKPLRTVMMIAVGGLAVVLLIGVLTWIVNNGAPSRERASVTSPLPPVVPSSTPTAPTVPPATPSGMPTAATIPPATPSGTIETIVPATPSVAKPPATTPLDRGADVVREFYAALGRGDGTLAATFVAPERQKGGLSPQAMTSFYSKLAQPLQLVSVVANGQNAYQATYTYQASTKPCKNSVDVTLTLRNGRYLIQSIDAHGGC